MYNVIMYETAMGHIPLSDFIIELKKENNCNLVKLIACIDRLKILGFELLRVTPKAIKKIQGIKDLYELKIDNIRVFFLYHNNNFILLHGFKKKDNATPKLQLDKAKQEINDYIRRI